MHITQLDRRRWVESRIAEPVLESIPVASRYGMRPYHTVPRPISVAIKVTLKPSPPYGYRVWPEPDPNWAEPGLNQTKPDRDARFKAEPYGFDPVRNFFR